MSVVDRWHDARREEDRAAVQALDVLQLAVTVLAEAPKYLMGEAAEDDATDEELAHQMQLLEMLRLARLYADSRLLDHVATSQVIDRLSEGLA